MNGNALTPWVLQDDPLRKAQLLGTYLGCPSRKTKDLVDCLKQRPTRQVVESIKIMRPWLFNPFSPLGIVVEKSGSNKFLVEHPYRLLKEGRFYDVPWITSLTSEEGLYPAADYVLKRNYLSELDKRWLELAPSVLDYNYTIPDGIKDQVSTQIKDEYLKGQPISPTTYKNLIDMMSDRLFSIPAEKAAKLQAHSTKSPVYVYYFCYTGEKLESFTVHFAKQDQDDGKYTDLYSFILILITYYLCCCLR
ncbi:carboxylic ester hydrolase [Holotrichia oblita]|uniref:Carboxylic ester hydrolase n=1 Tax=Holotrichia oblita TaxID=644536 RepID=A0ACB9TV60_HOLOL|nr:carboxylic ester hydrolase [Holotrichia oblita]